MREISRERMKNKGKRNKWGNKREEGKTVKRRKTEGKQDGRH